ncbi:hypothetical protein BDZ45DRAFT_673166 [Acephala macrosclerotiorum]|nr:hypothetical protein BDZ45DRAFT_673166 [Acephala macrosclerotiorum]
MPKSRLAPLSPPPASQTTQIKSSLHEINQLLHLIHHRNKNQHRLLKWYKPFSILRRNIAKLHSEVEILETAEKFSSKGGKGEKYVKEAREVVEDRVEFLGERVLGSAYLAFSTVVKNLQYAHLGVMLLGMLARIRSVIRPLGKEKPEEDEEEDEEEVFLKRSEQVMELAREDEDMQDLGEVVRREELAQDEEQDEEEETQAVPKTLKGKRAKAKAMSLLDSDSESRPRKSSKEEKKKKKRKRGDAFDDLFDGLI